ncbi:mycobactin polyketide synthase MbtD [Mycobacterium attenuatum]
MMATHRLPDDRVPILLSAHEAELIGQDAAAILNYLARLGAEAADVTPAVAATLLRTRRVRRHRAVVRAADRGELEAGLRALAVGDRHPLIARSSENAKTRTAFVFPGQGNQWPAMGAEAYQRLPAYRAEADRCAEAFAATGLPSPLSYLLAGSSASSSANSDEGWSQIDIQGAQFTHAASLAQLWRSCGVLPDLTVGHSLGEAAAAYVAGTITLAAAVAVVAARATVVGRLSGRYGMAVLSMGADQAARMIAEAPGWLEVSAVNSPSSTVVSGDGDAVAAIVRLAEKDGIFARELTVDYPGHTSKLESLRETLSDLLPASEFLDAPVEFVSSARSDVVTPDTDFTGYWYQNLRNTVRFDRAVATAVQRGAGTFVEMSAHPSLLYALAELAEDALSVGSGRRDEPVVEHLSANIAAAAVANPGYRWSDVAGVGDQSPLRGFPAAPMRAIHLWATPEPLPPAPGTSLVVAYERWERSQPHQQRQDSLADRAPTVAIVTPDADGLDALTRRLTEAVAAHQECELTGPEEAEVAVLVAPALMHPDPTAATDQIRGSTGQLDYRRAIGPRCRRVWLVTVCGEQLDASAPAALPAQSALAALHRSVGFEFPDQTFAHLDVPSRDIDEAAAHRCVDVLLGDHSEVALRIDDSGTGKLGCFVRTLCESAAAAPQGVDAAALDHVVITGGNGTIGLRYARYCIEHGARRVTLLSRNGVGKAELDRLAEGYPAQVHAPACDITDADALSAVAVDYAGDGASLLVHAAGAARFAPHDQLGDQELADVFSAKVTGLARMTDVWPLRRDGRILLCSSVSGVWGGYGHGAYAASNRLLDAVAAQLRSDGLDCVSVRWGLWQGTTIAGVDEVARIERSGLIAMDPDVAIAASLGRHQGDPLILAADFDRLRVFFESQGAALPFTTAATERDSDSAAPGESPEQRPISELVRAEIASAFSLDGPASVDLNAALVDLGADSMLALDLRDRLRRWTGQSVPAARLLGGITGAELIEILQSAPRADGSAGPAPAAQPDSTADPERPDQRRERLKSSRD